MVRRNDINQPLKNGNLNIALILGLFFAVFAGGALTYAIARPHFWLRADDAKITLNGEPLANARVYRSSRGTILIRITNCDGFLGEYIYSPNLKVLAVPAAEEFSYRDDVAFAKNDHQSIDERRIRSPYNDPTMSVSNDVLEFETDKGSVVVEMGEPLNLDIPHNYF